MISVVTIVGVGRVGGALSARLMQQGAAVHTVSRANMQQWLSAPSRLGEVLVIAVSGTEIPTVAAAIARAKGQLLADVVALHVNGSLRPSALQPLDACGARLASAHPFQTFANADPSALDGIGWGIECTDADWPMLDHFVVRTGGTPVRLHGMTDERKRQYHAAAVAASNFTYAAVQLGRDLAEGVGIPSGVMLAPIVERTARNAAAALRQDSPLALTGPIVRGDVAELRRQFEAIPTEVREAYRNLAKATVECVRQHLGEATTEEMFDVLR